MARSTSRNTSRTIAGKSARKTASTAARSASRSGASRAESAGRASAALRGASRAAQVVAALPVFRQSVEQALSAGKDAVEFVQTNGLKALNEAQRRSSALTFKAREAAEQRLEAVAVKVVGTWDQVEQVASERVGRTLNRLGVPSQKDIDKLTRSVAKLSTQIEALSAAAAKAKTATASRTPRAASRRAAPAAAA